MVLVVKWFIQQYTYWFMRYSDVRLASLPLMQSPLPVLIILGSYLYFIKSLGPRLMKDRKAFELKNLLIVYNVIQVVLNLALATYGLKESYLDGFSLRCQSVNLSLDRKAYLESYLTYCYFVLKVVDLLDTIFFVLRKKWNQISFLHLYHHVGVTFGAWLAAKFFPGGHITLLGVINSYVHVVMYFYYFLTAFKPELKKSMWWKKYITQMQLVQFAILTVHFFGPLLFPVETCTFPKFVFVLGGIQNCFMMLMFGDFYYKAYIRKSKPSDDEAVKQQTTNVNIKAE